MWQNMYCGWVKVRFGGLVEESRVGAYDGYGREFWIGRVSDDFGSYSMSDLKKPGGLAMRPPGRRIQLHLIRTLQFE